MALWLRFIVEDHIFWVAVAVNSRFMGEEVEMLATVANSMTRGWGGAVIVAATILFPTLVRGERALKNEAEFGFPLKAAVLLENSSDLRLAAWNDANYLYIQAVLWNDSVASGTIKGSGDHRPNDLGDNSSLLLDLDKDGAETRNLDRAYSLNPWQDMTGLHYVIQRGSNANSGLFRDSHGRGAIRYVQSSDGRVSRVDSYLIPLDEIQTKPGAIIGIGFYTFSPFPPFKLAVPVTPPRPNGQLYSHDIPYSKLIPYRVRTEEIGSPVLVPDDYRPR